MADKYTAILTTLGEAKFAQAVGTQSIVDLTKIVIGDGRGQEVVPNRGMRTLVREVWRGNVSKIGVDPLNAANVIVEAVVPASVGGWTVREVGVLDSVGDLLVVANYPTTFKPIAATGADKVLQIRLTLKFTNPNTVKAVTIFDSSSTFKGIAAGDYVFKDGIVRVNSGRNIVVVGDAVSNSFKISSKLESWSAMQDYDPMDFVANDGGLYRCLVKHVSNINFADDLDKWEQLGGGGGGDGTGGTSLTKIYYDIAGFVQGNPTDNGVVDASVELMRFITTRPFRFFSGMTDSQACASVGPVHALEFPMMKNGTQFGMMKFAASLPGEQRFATWQNDEVIFNPKDVLTIMSPIEKDPQIRDLEWTLAALLY